MDLQPSTNLPKRWAAVFFSIWTGQAFSLLGSQIVQFALIWWLTKTTNSATVLATASLVGLLPQVLLGPVAGTLVDRINRKLVMIIADLSVALATLFLIVLFWSGNAQIWQVYFFMFLRAVAGSFHWPAWQASTSLMVPKEHFARIQGFNQMLGGMMSIISAPLAALLMDIMPMQSVLAIDIVTAAIAVVPVGLAHIPQPARGLPGSTSAENPSFWDDFRAGLRYAFGWPGLVLIGAMAALINLLIGPAISLMPILVTRHFGGLALQLAWMESAWGVGMVIGGLALGAWGGFKRRVYTSLLGLLLLGTCMALIGVTPGSALYLAIALMFLVGFAQPLINGPLMAVIQAAVAPEMQGRVFTLIGSVSAVMMPLGLMVAGPVADAWSVQTWYILGGIVTALLGLSAFFVPAVVHVEDSRSAPPGAGGELQPVESSLTLDRPQPDLAVDPGK